MRRSHRLGSLLAALVFTSPMLAPAMESLAQVVSPLPSEIRRQAISDRSTWSIERRAYKKIVQECERMKKAGLLIVCPNINDLSAIRDFLRGKFTFVGSSSSAASSFSSSASSVV
jgi:hypothetical protein